MKTYPKSQKFLDNPKALCNIVRRIALEAGGLLLDYFDDPDFAKVEQKSDGSPVTIADREAENLIRRKLADITPDVPFIGEEIVSDGAAPDITGHRYFWMVDALDGTRSFIADKPDFTVNIALICDGEPVMGVVYAPVHGELYSGCGEGTALRWLEETDNEKPIQVRSMPKQGLTVLTSNSFGSKPRLERFLENFKVAKVIGRSSSIKMCHVAAGKADLNPRFGPTCEWDTAAADAVLRAAGGMITDLAGVALRYGRQDEDFLNPEFIASSFEWYSEDIQF